VAAAAGGARHRGRHRDQHHPGQLLLARRLPPLRVPHRGRDLPPPLAGQAQHKDAAMLGAWNHHHQQQPQQTPQDPGAGEFMRKCYREDADDLLLFATLAAT